jgi:hypothetical protein
MVLVHPLKYLSIDTSLFLTIRSRQMNDSHLSKRDDTSIGTATKTVRCGSLLMGLRFSYAQARWIQGFLSGLGRRSVIPYVH